MRIATMIISLILMLVVGAQSCAVSLGEAARREDTLGKTTLRAEKVGR